MWTNYDSTPFERLGADEQFPRDLAVSTADWLVQESPRSPRRPSMVVDPPTGRVPLRQEAVDAKNAMLAQPSDSLAVQPMIQVISSTTKVIKAATTCDSVSEEMNRPIAMYAAPIRNSPR